MSLESNGDYYPNPESQGGWRHIADSDELRTLSGMDPISFDKVEQKQFSRYGGDSWSIVVVRHGYVVKELHTFNVGTKTTFDIWSCTKSFTSTAWGLLLDDSRNGKSAKLKKVDLESPAYDFIPEGLPLSDKRKGRIQLKHLLSMTSGIAGERELISGIADSHEHGPFEFALGKGTNRFGDSVDTLTSEPGDRWDYSDAAFAHLSLAFSNVAGEEIAAYLIRRVLEPIGVQSLTWDVQGGSGHLGPHTNAHTGIHISARDLARFAYLILRRGNWLGRQLVPESWITVATAPSQTHNRHYGYAWWLNTDGSRWPRVPSDAFALEGYRANRCYIVPSLDLVVSRVGSGPSFWDEELLTDVIGTIVH
jgi:CubicO group peptidase (beta-lactamase class C family)